MNVLVTGADGFIGKNLIWHLRAIGNSEILTFNRRDSLYTLRDSVFNADFIYHLAGVNRPMEESEFYTGNSDLTAALCNAIRETGRAIPVVFSSSIHATTGTAYGRSKRMAENHLLELSLELGNQVYIYRLTNVFGKWCKPNYNSVVATLCHNIANGLPTVISNPEVELHLAYVDDVAEEFTNLLKLPPMPDRYHSISHTYRATLGELAAMLAQFKQERQTLLVEQVSNGLLRALYSTYLSYLRPEQSSYGLAKHSDARGSFVEVVKTRDSGQFSYFTSKPGITRGGHFHHTKAEKFIVVKGSARFTFQNVNTGDRHEITTHADHPTVVETLPGWSHDVTNIGDDEMVVMLWANELFNRERPDTIPFRSPQ